jgi:hypothetical protein
MLFFQTAKRFQIITIRFRIAVYFPDSIEVRLFCVSRVSHPSKMEKRQPHATMLPYIQRREIRPQLGSRQRKDKDHEQ